jgi:uncharacterized membrane protein
MTLLIAGLVIFIGMHSTSIVMPGFRDSMVAKIGEWPWKGLYSIISLLGFVLIINGYPETRLDPTVLYTPPVWLRHIAMLLLIVVFPMLLATYFSGRIKRTLKNPMILSIKIWAFAHLLANGNLADVLLFGGFLLWAVASLIMAKRREPRAVPALPESKWNDLLAVVIGLGVYVAMVLWGHQALIGMPVV